MTREWQIEYEGALYHCLSRGNERRNIFHMDDDRQLYMDIIVLDGADKHRAYRQAAQSYAQEEKQLLEDINHGFIVGSNEQQKNWGQVLTVLQ